MDKNIRSAQKEVLRVFAKKAKVFALTGGTALELYYLKHRFSADLDFFSPRYKIKEIEEIVGEFKAYCRARVKLENEFIAASHAKVRFYSVAFKGLDGPIK